MFKGLNYKAIMNSASTMPVPLKLGVTMVAYVGLAIIGYKTGGAIGDLWFGVEEDQN